MLTPATVIDRIALAESWVSTNFSLSAGLPERSRGDVSADCAIGSPPERDAGGIIALTEL
jgi:hypothetical protein